MGSKQIGEMQPAFLKLEMRCLGRFGIDPIQRH